MNFDVEIYDLNNSFEDRDDYYVANQVHGLVVNYSSWYVVGHLHISASFSYCSHWD